MVGRRAVLEGLRLLGGEAGGGGVVDDDRSILGDWSVTCVCGAVASVVLVPSGGTGDTAARPLETGFDINIDAPAYQEYDIYTVKVAGRL